jgi:hypothetical protein
LVLKPLINFLIIIPIGGLIFFIVLYLARGIEWHDVKDLYFSFAKRNSK